MIASSSKRRAERYHLNSRFTGAGGSFTISDRCVDISRMGVGIKSLRSLARDEVVDLTIDLPDNNRLKVKGRVVWSGDTAHAEKRIGIEFVEIGSAELAVLEQLLISSSHGDQGAV